MGKVVIAVGSPGAGKTSVLEAANGKYKVVNVGDIITGLGISKGHIRNRDEIRYMPNDIFVKMKSLAFTKIAKMPGNLVLDTHASVEQHGRFIPGLPIKEIKKLNVVGLVYIDASTDSIIERRKRDKTRVREEEARTLIDTQRSVNIAVLSYYFSMLNVPLFIIDNREGKISESRRSFLKGLKEAFD